MNKAQYTIVKRFTNMGATPMAIAKGFKAPITEVNLVAGTHNYEQCTEKLQGGEGNPLTDMLRGMGL